MPSIFLQVIAFIVPILLSAGLGVFLDRNFHLILQYRRHRARKKSDGVAVSIMGAYRYTGNHENLFRAIKNQYSDRSAFRILQESKTKLFLTSDSKNIELTLAKGMEEIQIQLHRFTATSKNAMDSVDDFVQQINNAHREASMAMQPIAISVEVQAPFCVNVETLIPGQIDIENITMKGRHKSGIEVEFNDQVATFSAQSHEQLLAILRVTI
jgi:hypothetical protein